MKLFMYSMIGMVSRGFGYIFVFDLITEQHECT